MAETVDWKKWFSGFFDPTRIIKDAGTLIRMVIILAICFFTYLGLKQVNIMFKPKTAQPSVGQVTAQGEKSKVDNNVDSSVNAKKTGVKIGLFNW